MKKLVVSTVVALSLLTTIPAAFAAAGQLDPAFGNGGIVRTDFSNLGTNFGFTGAALAPNGDIVVGGTLQNVQGITEVGVIVRYLSNGALDPSFGNGGMVVLPPPSSFFLGSSVIVDVAVQSNGDILTMFSATDNSGTAHETLLVRLNTNGQFDTSFGSGGQVALNFPAPSRFSASASSIAIQPDGKILLSGAVTPPRRSTASPLTLLARYLSNGALDQAFGSGGIVETVAVNIPNSVSVSGANILAGNYLGQIAEFSSTGALLRVSPSTALTVNGGQPGVFLANGELLVGNTIAGPFKNNQDAIVHRYNLSGLDSTFHSAVVRIASDAPFAQNTPVAIGHDTTGRIVVGLASGVARLNANGSLDGGFGNQGIGTIVPSTNFNTILVQPSNNDIVAIGSGVLVRYLAQ